MQCLLLLALLAGPAIPAAEAPAESTGSSRLWSEEDGWLDISGFLDEAHGFVPLLVPITEPAVGEGAAGALVFIDKPPGDAAPGLGRPNISVAGALGTNNGTRGAFAADVRHWRDEHLKTLVGVVDASINLEFHGIGPDRLLADDPRSFNLDTTAGLFQVRQRIGESNAWLGLGYVLADTQVRFDLLPPVESLPDPKDDARAAGLLPSLSFDSRNNAFTPTGGTYLEASAGIFSKALGSDDDFQRVNLTGIHYLPLAETLTLGVMASSVLSYGDVPFYLRPYVVLRGAPAMRYQGEHAAQVEAELRWQFWKRLSLVGFAGSGHTWSDTRLGNSREHVGTGGLGFRYEIARRYGLHMGIDAAHGPEGMAYYLQFGSAWMRP